MKWWSHLTSQIIGRSPSNLLETTIVRTNSHSDSTKNAKDMRITSDLIATYVLWPTTLTVIHLFPSHWFGGTSSELRSFSFLLSQNLWSYRLHCWYFRRNCETTDRSCSNSSPAPPLCNIGIIACWFHAFTSLLVRKLYIFASIVVSWPKLLFHKRLLAFPLVLPVRLFVGSIAVTVKVTF